MDSTTKEKALNLEDLQSGAKQILNKTFGNVGTCSTAAATAAKAVTLGTTFELVTGATILVTFTNGITVDGATLAVTHTPIGGSSTTEAAKPIYYKGAALPANLVKAGMTVTLRYDGTNYNVLGTLDNETDINYDSNTGKLKKTVNGTTSDVCDVVTSGFSLMEDDATGIDTLGAIGGATISDDNTNGLDVMNF